jgi:hypothetical protein
VSGPIFCLDAGATERPLFETEKSINRDVIDRVGRPDSRSRPKSGRDPDFTGVVTGTRVATWIFFSKWKNAKIMRKRDNQLNSTRFEKISGRDRLGHDPSLGRDPNLGRDPKFFRVTIPTRSRPPTLVYTDYSKFYLGGVLLE